MKSVSITIKGKVQGVGFRYFLLQLAIHLDVNGTVRNCANGNVHAEIEARDDLVLKFIDQCRVGPPRSDVKEVVVESIKFKGFTNFEIIG